MDSVQAHLDTVQAQVDAFRVQVRPYCFELGLRQIPPGPDGIEQSQERDPLRLVLVRPEIFQRTVRRPLDLIGREYADRGVRHP